MSSSPFIRNPEENLGHIIENTRTQLGYEVFEEHSARGMAVRLWYGLKRIPCVPEFDENAIIRDAAGLSTGVPIPVMGFPMEDYHSMFVHPYVAEQFARLLNIGMSKYLATRGHVDHPQKLIDSAYHAMLTDARRL